MAQDWSRRGAMVALGGAFGAVGAVAARARPALAPPGARTIPPAWTAAEALPLWTGAPPGGPFVPRARRADLPPAALSNIATPELHIFRPARGNGRGLLVIPGGAYMIVSIGNEGVDVARVMTAAGYTVFVLTYRLPGEGWTPRADVPLQDAQRAMRLVRQHAARFGIDPAGVGVLGFSAGGHLAASLLTGADEAVYAPRDAVDHIAARPAYGGLIYPVIAMAPPLTHAQSAALLLGPQPDAALVARRSPAEHVGAATPPIFLAHALDDPAVPFRNSVVMMEAMQAARRPVEAHFFEEGGHGFGLGDPRAPASLWPRLFQLWIDRQLA